MCKSKLIKLNLSLFLLFLAGQINAQSISINGSVGNGVIKRGTAAQGAVIINIPSGLHLNSSNPKSEYAIPTSVRLTASEIKLSIVRYPRGTNRKFSFSEKTINVYEGRKVFTFNLNIPTNFTGKTIKIRAVVRYQVCTNEFCYPPKTQEVILTARVK